MRNKRKALVLKTGLLTGLALKQNLLSLMFWAAQDFSKGICLLVK